MLKGSIMAVGAEAVAGNEKALALLEYLKGLSEGPEITTDIQANRIIDRIEEIYPGNAYEMEYYPEVKKK